MNDFTTPETARTFAAVIAAPAALLLALGALVAPVRAEPAAASAPPAATVAATSVRALVPATLTPVEHTADVVFLEKSTGQKGSVPSVGQLRALLTKVSDYWARETLGAVPLIAEGEITRVKTSYDVCSIAKAWAKGADAFGRTPATYQESGSTRHLIVIVRDATCAGLGTASFGQQKLAGGTVWVNLGTQKVTEGVHPVAHEIGHNFGLNHANARLCGKGVVDAAYSGTKLRKPCVDEEYGDLWSVMGLGIVGYSSQPPPLSLNQRDYLGVLPPGVVRDVTPAGGASQTVTIRALGIGDGSSGVRGLRVAPDGGDPFYVEYRSGRNHDAVAGRPATWSVGPTGGKNWLRTEAGVKIVKTPKKDPSASTVLTSWKKKRGSGGEYTEVLRTGQKMRPHGNATVTVMGISKDRTAAKIKITFAKPLKKLTATPVPKISGTAKAGRTLKAKAGTWKPSGVKLSYRWKRNGTSIAGATKSSYRVTAADRGKTLTVTVTGSKSGYAKTAKKSAGKKVAKT
ncbi:MAG: hypothetical protein KDB25_01335 [Leucobacter sp.]|nr:hypothetical protein [Leucobacter sp.]